MIVYPGGIPTFLQGDKVGNDFRGRDGPILCYIAYWVISLVIVIFFIGDVMLYRVYFSPVGYLLFSNVYFINIVCNVLGKRTISDHPASMCINVFFIGYFPFTHYGPTLWVDGFNTTWVVWFLILQGIQIGVISCQFMFGSRFFLPKRCRSRTYDKFRKVLAGGDNEASNTEQCNLCMNALSEPELEYADSDQNYTYEQFDRGTYFELP